MVGATWLLAAGAEAPVPSAHSCPCTASEGLAVS
jgi:hypothetical protein